MPSWLADPIHRVCKQICAIILTLPNLSRLILQNEEELTPLLSEKAKEVLEKLRDNQSELNDLNECGVFVCGFRLGARIMLEVLDGSDKWGEFEE